VKTIDKARKYLNVHGDDLRKKFNANGVAVGYKNKGGKYTGTIALIFYVNKKKNARDLLAEGILSVPAEVDGIPTDIVTRSKDIRPR
jgi:hypothetical protein